MAPSSTSKDTSLLATGSRISWLGYVLPAKPSIIAFLCCFETCSQQIYKTHNAFRLTSYDEDNQNSEYDQVDSSAQPPHIARLYSCKGISMAAPSKGPKKFPILEDRYQYKPHGHIQRHDHWRIDPQVVLHKKAPHKAAKKQK